MLRLCILNHSTSQAEVDRALELAATLPVETAPGPPTMIRESYPTIEAGWVGRSSLDADALRSFALFASFDREQSERVLRTAHEHAALTGEAVVGQWQISRDLYVVLNGAVAITVDGDRVRTLGPGEFFGELAAIDWGAGFGRTRSATVTAIEPTRLLVLDWVLVNWLMQAAPAFRERLEQASRERLAAL